VYVLPNAHEFGERSLNQVYESAVLSSLGSKTASVRSAARISMYRRAQGRIPFRLESDAVAAFVAFRSRKTRKTIYEGPEKLRAIFPAFALAASNIEYGCASDERTEATVAPGWKSEHEQRFERDPPVSYGRQRQTFGFKIRQTTSLDLGAYNGTPTQQDVLTALLAFDSLTGASISRLQQRRFSTPTAIGTQPGKALPMMISRRLPVRLQRFPILDSGRNTVNRLSRNGFPDFLLNPLQSSHSRGIL